MKLSAIMSALMLPLALHAGSIIQKPLDEFVIYDIPVAYKSGTTTIMFPPAISGLYAKSVATQEQENATRIAGVWKTSKPRGRSTGCHASTTNT